MNMNSSVRVVLVQPRNPLNIGAAARAMANFGLSDLVVVDPYEEVWRETVSAVGAEDLIRKAWVVKTLAEAVADCRLVLGTSAIKERKLAIPVLRLPDLSAYLKKRAAGPLALVFGSEKTGLTKEHYELCNACVTIPTSARTPSMNLSHAVAVFGYVLAGFKPAKPAGPPLATAEERERLVALALELFAAADFLAGETPTRKAQKVRRMINQWNVHASDIQLLNSLLRRLKDRFRA